jgi:hypothetical protein
VREDGRMVGGEEWQEKLYNREEWKKLLRMARNHHILHMAVEWNSKNNKNCLNQTHIQLAITIFTGFLQTTCEMPVKFQQQIWNAKRYNIFCAFINLWWIFTSTSRYLSPLSAPFASANARFQKDQFLAL